MQKAKDLSEITKLNMAVSESETKIKDIKFTVHIGKIRWKKSKRKLARSGSWKRLWKHANCRSRQSMQ